MKSMTIILRYTGYLNFIKYHINPVLFIILVHVLLIELSKLLTTCLTSVKNHVIKHCNKIYERNGKNLFCSIKIQVRFLIN